MDSVAGFLCTGEIFFLPGCFMSRLKKHFGIFAWSHPEFLGECPGEIMDGIKSEHKGNLADGILSFAYHLPAGFKL